MKRLLLAAAVLPLLANVGCDSMSNTDKGALGGGALGAGLGALAAGPRNAGAGALIGGGIGAVTGGLLGHSEDQKEKARADAIAAHTAGPAQLQDIAGMAQNHISDPVIISKIRTDGFVYHLSGEDITYLKSYGVSDPVIETMTSTAGYPRRIYAPAPVYVVQPAPPPPVAVGIGVGIR
jgi:Glycine zipper